MEYWDELRRADHRIADRDAEIARLNAELNDRDAEIERLTAELKTARLPVRVVECEPFTIGEDEKCS